MSVLIKDMEMPEHCGYCRFRYDGICHALQKTQYSVTECPLVSVPTPHEPEIIRCKDCKHFEYDHPYIILGIPILGHELCNAWGDGCKTDKNGYCFMAERRTDG